MRWLVCPFFFYLHVVHDELEEPSQGAAFFLYSRIHFFHRLGKILLNFTTTFFLPPPWRERNKNFQQSVEKLQKKNQLRLLFNIGSGVTTPRGQSPLFKKKLFKNSSGKGRRGEHTWVQSEVLMLGFSQPMLPAGQLDKPPKNPHIMPEPAAFCLENVGHCF